MFSLQVKGEQNTLYNYKEGLELINSENYEEAKVLFKNLNKKGLNNETKYYITQALAFCFYKLNDCDSAQYINEDYFFEPIDFSTTIKADSLYADAIKNLYANKIDNAIINLEKCIEIQSQIFEKDHFLLAKSYDWLSYALSLKTDYVNSAEKKNEALTIYSQYFEFNPGLVVKTAISLAELYDYNGQFGKAYECLTKILIKIDPKNQNFFDIRNRMSNYLSKMGRYSEALDLENETCSFDDLENKYIIQSLCNKAEYFVALGEISQAFQEIEKALELSSKENYLIDKVKVLGLQATLYSISGNQVKAIEIGKTIVEIRKELNVDYKDVAMAYNNLARYYSFLGLFSNAIYNQNKCIEYYIMSGFANLPEMAYAYNNLSDYYANQNKYDEALDFQKKSLEILLQNFPKQHPDYAIALNNLARLYFLMGNYDEAILLGNDVLKIRESVFKDSHSDIAVAYMNLSAYHLGKKEFQNALIYINKALTIYENLLGTNNADYVRAIEFKAEIYSAMDDFKMAIDELTPLENYYKMQFGESSPIFIDYAKEMAFLFSKVGNYDSCMNYIGKVSETLDSYTLTTFGCLSSNDRSQFWERNKHWYFELLPYLTYALNTPDVRSTMYNSLLTSKGILLSTEIEIEETINNSRNKDLINKWNRLSELKSLLSYRYSGFKGEVDVDSLNSNINILETEILESIQQYEDIFKKFKIKWQDIQGILAKDEIAVEFFTYNKKYLALIITSDCASPLFLELFNEDEIYWPTKTRVAGDLKSYNRKIWQPILSICKQNVSKIYFSPYAKFYNTPIEYAVEENNVSDGIKIFRLSSTRELLDLKGKKNNLEVATIYGGLKYENENMIEDLINNDSINEDIKCRNNFDYLPGTLREIEEINTILLDHNIITDLYSEYLGTEESFYQLNGKGVNILHIATHGFYYKSSFDNEWINRILSQYPPQYLTSEDAALCRTGVLLSYAKEGLSNNSKLDNRNDGILTAKDISHINLSGLSLAVLSACQTGQGDITEDGVFGLQRGLKKAGARSLLMSLWNVNDDATQLLMSVFYKKILSGYSYNDALREAQSELREYKNGMYNYPKYWAAFILLDSI